MKSIKLLLLVVGIVAQSALMVGQDPPNLQNGVPPQGSYDGSSVDTVNLVNGNLTLHIPLPFDYPQRGQLGIKYYLIVNAKTWQAQGNPATMTGQWVPTSACATGTSGPCGQGPLFVSTASFAMTRIWEKVWTDGQFPTYSATEPDTLVTWDGSAHGIGNRTYDTSGYSLQVSGDDGNGVYTTATIIDRNGTQYIGGFPSGGVGECSVDPGNGLPGWTQTTTCVQHWSLNSVVDANGNVLSPPFPIPALDSPAGPSVAAHAAVGSESAGCLTSFGTPWVYYFNYPAPNGQTNQIKLCFAPYPQLATSFSQPGVHQFQDVYSGHPFPGNWRPPVYLTNVIFPDNTQWSINYDSYGEITSVGTPTGASVQYGWGEGSFPACNLDGNDITKVSRAVQSRTVTDANGHSFIWNYQWTPQASDGTLTHTVTDPSNNDTVHVFVDLTAAQITPLCDYREIRTVSYQGSGGGRTPLKQVDTTWLMKRDGGFGVPTDVKTTLFPSQKVGLVHTDYDSSSPTLGLVTSQKIYDWGQGAPGALLRETDLVYQWQKDSRYLTANMLDLLASTVVISPVAASNIKSNCPVDGAGTLKSCMAETDYTYDEAAYLISYEGTVGALPAGTHLAAPNPVRGNATTLSKWLNTGGSIVSHNKWYDTGEVYQATDPGGHTSTFSYDLAYKGAQKTQTCNAKNQCTSATYDINTGLLLSLTDINASSQANGTTPGDPAHTSTYTYDSMRRMTSGVSPADSNGAHPQVSFSYPNPITIQGLRTVTSTLNESTTTHYDGLGHVSRGEHVTPTGTVIVDTAYDGLGRTISITNPYLTTADATYGEVHNIYDGLGRATTSTEQDGSVKTNDYSGGNCIVGTDEAGKQRRTCNDALGRLVEVDEPGGSFVGTQSSGGSSISGTLQSKIVGATNASAGTGSVTITGSEGSVTTGGGMYCAMWNENGDCVDWEIDPGTTTYDSGTVTITVNGHSNSVAYGSASTASSIASGLASAINGDGSAFVNASATSGVLSLTARTTGTSTNYSWSLSHSSSDPTDFGAAGSFGSSPASGALSGGANGSSGTTVYDAGTVTITIGTFTASTSYGQSGNSTASAVAAALAGTGPTGLSRSGSPVNASASGSSITITYNSVGTAGNITFSCSSSTSQATYFSSPSFTCPAVNNLTGGTNSEGPSLDHNYFVTQYTYDALGNLLRVDQKGSAPNDSTQWRTRLFTYDSLSRLLTSFNPEVGTITYAYDADGNVLQKTSPAANQTGSAIQTISYCYDELHRVTGTAYSAQSCPLTTPVVTYTYDAGTNGKGHMTSMTDQAGTATYTYDALGRISSQQRTITGVSKAVSFDYFVGGAVKALHYPSGRVVNYTYDSAGRPITAIDGNNIQYIGNVTYYPSGMEYQRFMPGIYFRTDLNKRLQISGYYSDNGQTTGYYMNKTYSYSVGQNNGNVLSIVNNKDPNRTQIYTYDALNRLASGSSQGNTGASSWGENYTIDAWGNLLISPMAGKASGGNFQCAGDASNRATCLAYDAAGNLTSYQSALYNYDPENRLHSTAGVTYTYDGAGQRVLKSQAGSPVKTYWFGLAEGDGNGNITSEYVFFKDDRVARIDLANNSVHYYLSDHLKSTSMVVSAAGAIEEEADYSGFGREIAISSGANRYKYQGKETDSESQLDYFGARYYFSVLGRFTSPDWSAAPVPVPYAELSDPQTLNLYSFVRNSPITRLDPDGHDYVFAPFQNFNDDDGGSNIESTHNHIYTVTLTKTEYLIDGKLAGISSIDHVKITQVGVPGTIYDGPDPLGPQLAPPCNCTVQTYSKPIEDVQKIPVLKYILGLFIRHLFFDVQDEDGEFDISGQWNKKTGELYMQKITRSDPKATNDYQTGRKVGAPVHDCALAHAVLDGADAFKNTRYVLFPGPNSNSFYHWLADRVGFPDVHPFGTPGYRHAMTGQ